MGLTIRHQNGDECIQFECFFYMCFSFFLRIPGMLIYRFPLTWVVGEARFCVKFTSQNIQFEWFII